MGRPALFPMPLLYPPALGPRRVFRRLVTRSNRSRSRQMDQGVAWGLLWTNLLEAFFNFLTLGWPIPRRLKGTQKWASRALSLVRAEVAGRLLQEAVRRVPAAGGAIGTTDGGRSRLQSAVARMSCAYGSNDADPLTTIAEMAALQCIDVPERAGIIDPANLPEMPSEKSEALRHLENTILSEEAWPQPLRRCCRMISVEDELVLVRRCIAKCMGILAPEEEFPTGPDGRPLIGEWFCVRHSPRQGADDRGSYSTAGIITPRTPP